MRRRFARVGKSAGMAWMAILQLAVLSLAVRAQDAVQYGAGAAADCFPVSVAPSAEPLGDIVAHPEPSISASEAAAQSASAPQSDRRSLTMSYVEATPNQTAGPLVDVVNGNNANLHVIGDTGGEISAEPRRFQYGLQVTVRGVYDDNINISHSDRLSDYYFAIEPSITIGFGDISGQQDNYIRLDYAPSVLLFTNHSENDAIQHLIHLEGQHRFSRLTLTLRQDVSILDGTDIGTITDASTPGSHVNLDVSGRTRVNIFGTHLNASYDLTGKLFLSAGVDASVTDYPNSDLFSSQAISGNAFINYRYSDKLVLGLGGTGGYDFVDDPNPNQSFEQANARINYALSGKVSLNASGGVEFRQFENNSRGEYVSPVFDIGAGYQPFDGTNIGIAAARHTVNSAVLAGQDFATTTVRLSVRQRLLQRVYLGLAAGYESGDYFSTVSGVNASRTDDYFFVEPSVDVAVTRWCTFGAYYLHRENDSTLRPVSFYDNQVGIRVGLAF